MSHLVFYDGNCGLCDRTVQLLLKLDKHKKFVFAPLQGTTAEKFSQNLPKEYLQADSLILVENYKERNPTVYLMGKAVLRICWLLGGPWKLLGWMSALPSPPFDFIYRFVSRNRHKLFSSSCLLPNPEEKDRFLP